GTRPPAGLAGDFTGDDRHQRALIGPHFVYEVEQIRPRVALDVVFNVPVAAAERHSDVTNILRRDVTPIVTGMDGDTRRARGDADVDGFEDARHASAAGITERRDFVDVHRKLDHGHGRWLMAHGWPKCHQP